jgi:hypothetical protein
MDSKNLSRAVSLYSNYSTQKNFQGMVPHAAYLNEEQISTGLAFPRQ